MATFPDYPVAASVGSSMSTNAVMMDQAYFLRLFDLLYPLDYLMPMKVNADAGYEIFQAMAKVGERVSQAVQALETGCVILFASLGSKAKGAVTFARPFLAGGAPAVTIQKGTIVRASDGKRDYVTDTDLVFGVGVLSGSVTITAVAPGFEYNVRGSLTTAGGEVSPALIDTIWSMQMSPQLGDLTFAVSNPLPITGGTAAYLDGLGVDRGVVRRQNEGLLPYRLRVRTLPDTVSPAAIRRTLNTLVGSGNYYFREVGPTAGGVRGGFFDGDRVNPDLADYYDTDAIIFRGADMLSAGSGGAGSGLGIAQGEPVELRDPTGQVRAVGWRGTYYPTDVGLFVFIRRGSMEMTVDQALALGSISTGWVIVGRTSDGYFSSLTVQDTRTVNNARRFRVDLDYLEFRAFFKVGLPPGSLGEYGMAYDAGSSNAFDITNPAMNAFDGSPYVQNQLNLAVWNGLDAVRAGGVSFNLYIERIGA